MITDNYPERTGERWVLYKIISRYSWEALQSHKECHPDSSIEHLFAGLYLLKRSDAPCPCEARKRPTVCPRSARSVAPYTRRSMSE
jgi:hypothetical protein